MNKKLVFSLMACCVFALLLGNLCWLFAQESAPTTVTQAAAAPPAPPAPVAASDITPAPTARPVAIPPKVLTDLPPREFWFVVSGFIVIGIALFSSVFLIISISAYAACKAENKGAAFIPAIAPGTQSLYASVIAYFMVQRCVEAPVNCALGAFMCVLPLILSDYAQAVSGAACIRALDDPKCGLNAGFAALMVGMCETMAIVSFVMALLMVLKK